MLDTWVGAGAVTAAVLGLLAATWSRVKAIAWRMASLVVVRFTVEGQAGLAVRKWLWKYGMRSRYGDRDYFGGPLFVRPAERQLIVGFEDIGRTSTVFWVGNKPLIATITGNVIGGCNVGDKFTITCLRGTFDPDKLIGQAIDEMNEWCHGGDGQRFFVKRSTGNRARRKMLQISDEGKPAEVVDKGEQIGQASRRYLKWRLEDIGTLVVADPLGPLAFPPEIDKLVMEAKQWLASEKWYKSRRIPWRLGWLLYGLPGTGKSTLAKAVAMELDLPVFAPELATFDDVDLIEWWHKILANAPCMVLLEDIDTVFEGRVNKVCKDGDGLSFGNLLNCISGAEGADGIFLVVTTNKIEDVDPALGVAEKGGRSTRPGRIDRVIEMLPLTQDCRQRIADRILSDCPHKIERLVKDGDGMTGAQFQDLCQQEALAWQWRKSDG